MTQVIKYIQTDEFNPIGSAVHDTNSLEALTDNNLLDMWELAIDVRVAADQFLLQRLWGLAEQFICSILRWSITLPVLGMANKKLQLDDTFWLQNMLRECVFRHMKEINKRHKETLRDFMVANPELAFKWLSSMLEATAERNTLSGCLSVYGVSDQDISNQAQAVGL